MFNAISNYSYNQIETIDLSYTSISEECIKHLCDAIGKGALPALAHLIILDENLPKNSVVLFEDAFKKGRSNHIVDVSLFGKPTDLLHLQKTLHNRYKTFKSINTSIPGVDKEVLSLLPDENCLTVQEINIDCDKVSNEIMKVLLPSLLYFPDLMELTLSSINILFYYFILIIIIIDIHLFSKDVDLLTNNFNDDCFPKLIKLSLTSITFYNNYNNIDWQMDSMGFRNITQAIEDNHLSELVELRVISILLLFIYLLLIRL